MRTRKQINEYLYAEFGLESRPGANEAKISEDWPFQLKHLATISWPVPGTTIYEFHDGDEKLYAIAGEAPLNFIGADGLTPEELSLQYRGATWIGEQQPIDLNTSRIGDPNVPPAYERRKAIALLATQALGRDDGFRVLEGLYLRTSGQYLALIEDDGSGAAKVVGSQLNPHPVWHKMIRRP